MRGRAVDALTGSRGIGSLAASFEPPQPIISTASPLFKCTAQPQSFFTVNPFDVIRTCLVAIWGFFNTKH